MSDDKQAINENGDGQPVVKTAKQLEKEAAKAAKLAKLQQKQAAQAAQATAQQSAAPKEKVEVNWEKKWLPLKGDSHVAIFFSVEKGKSDQRHYLRRAHCRW